MQIHCRRVVKDPLEGGHAGPLEGGHADPLHRVVKDPFEDRGVMQIH